MFNVEIAQDVINRGQRASALLQSPDFQWIVNDQTSIHLAALVAAPPGERGRDARDYHHLQQHAITELVSLLEGYAQAGEAMLNVVKARNEAYGDDLEEDNHE